jgi:ADP-ribose pyrophosphatase YjhB (NUDIX family)
LLVNFIAKIWNSLAGPLRRQVAWVLNAKFIHGVAGVIRDRQGRILLLKHRFWKHQRWGMPGGHAKHGETFEETLRREAREETGLEVRPVRLLRAHAGDGWLTEFVLLAECDGEPKVNSVEILEARFFDPNALPHNILPAHERILREFLPSLMVKSKATAKYELVNVLRETKSLLALPQNDFAWSSWSDQQAALDALDGFITAVETDAPFDLSNLNLLFAPTGDIQEVSISSGWGKIFCAVAERFDRAIADYKSVIAST